MYVCVGWGLGLKKVYDLNKTIQVPRTVEHKMTAFFTFRLQAEFWFCYPGVSRKGTRKTKLHNEERERLEERKKRKDIIPSGLNLNPRNNKSGMSAPFVCTTKHFKTLLWHFKYIMLTLYGRTNPFYRCRPALSKDVEYIISGFLRSSKFAGLFSGKKFFQKSLS